MTADELRQAWQECLPLGKRVLAEYYMPLLLDIAEAAEALSDSIDAAMQGMAYEPWEEQPRLREALAALKPPQDLTDESTPD